MSALVGDTRVMEECAAATKSKVSPADASTTAAMSSPDDATSESCDDTDETNSVAGDDEYTSRMNEMLADDINSARPPPPRSAHSVLPISSAAITSTHAARPALNAASADAS